MLFPRRLLVAVFAILLVCSPLLAAAVQQQRSDPPPTPIELARAGKATEAWAQWNKLPAGADKLRSGVELAGETREIARGLGEVFDFRPVAIIRDLDLRQPIFGPTATFGHFGRTSEVLERFGRIVTTFPWERTDRVADLKTAVGV